MKNYGFEYFKVQSARHADNVLKKRQKRKEAKEEQEKKELDEKGYIIRRNSS